jgi:DNA-binding transcriptional LysR family regulator
LNLLKLQILVLIEKFKKVTDVANELSIKQPTVTFHMKSLEEELGVSLYQARGGRVWLSGAGKALYPYALKMTTLYDEAERTLEMFKKNGTGLLRVGAEDSYATPLLRGIRDLEQGYPDLQIEVRLGPESELGSMYAERGIDAIMMEKVAAGKYSGTFAELFEDELVMICGAQHEWAGCEEVTQEQLRSEKFIGYDSSTLLSSAASQWSEERQLGLLSMTAVSSFTAAVEAVQLGMGVAFAARSAAEGLASEGKEIAVLPLPGARPPKSFTVGLLYHEGEPVTRIAEELADKLML